MCESWIIAESASYASMRLNASAVSPYLSIASAVNVTVPGLSVVGVMCSSKRRTSSDV